MGTTDRTQLSDAANLVAKATDRRPTLPILGFVRVEASNRGRGTVRLSFGGELDPIRIDGGTDDGCLGVVMPQRI